MAQIVPVKIDTGSDMWREWSRQHKHEGRGIPIVFVVRADGETLYAKSGKPETEALGQLLTAALADAGYVMTENDVAVLKKVTAEFKDHRQNKDVQSAVKSLRKARRYLDRDGNVASYAEAAIELQNEIQALLDEANDVISEISELIDSAAGGDDAAQVEAVAEFQAARSSYQPVKSLKKSLSSIQAEINANKNLKAIQNGLRIIDSANAAKTETRKERSIRKLESLIKECSSAEIRQRAETASRKLQSQ